MSIFRHCKNLSLIHFFQLQKCDFQAFFIRKLSIRKSSGSFFFGLNIIKFFLLFINQTLNFFELLIGKQSAFMSLNCGQSQILRSLGKNICINKTSVTAQICQGIKYGIIQRTQTVIQGVIPPAFYIHHILDNILRRHTLLGFKEFFVCFLSRNINIIFHTARHRAINIQLAAYRFRIFGKDQFFHLNFIADLLIFRSRTSRKQRNKRKHTSQISKLIHRPTPQNTTIFNTIAYCNIM